MKASQLGFTNIRRNKKGDVSNLRNVIAVFNSKSKDKFQEHPDELGQGAYSIVTKHPTDPAKVVKFDTSKSEPELFKKLPYRLKKLGILPQVDSVSSFRIPRSRFGAFKKLRRNRVSAISREDLKDVPESDITKRIGKLSPRFRKVLSNFVSYGPGSYTRPLLKEVLSKWHKENEASKLPSDAKSKLKRFASDFRRLLHFGIIPYDLGTRNIGQRQSGELVIRDPGAYSVIPDVAKKPFIGARPITNQISKLRQRN